MSTVKNLRKHGVMSNGPKDTYKKAKAAAARKRRQHGTRGNKARKYPTGSYISKGGGSGVNRW